MKHLLLLLLCCLSLTAAAQPWRQMKTLDDAPFLHNKAYQKGNKYQRDAILFVDMLADTHPYYAKRARRDSLLSTQPALLKACGKCKSDSAFSQLLYGVLGRLHDKHTDLMDTVTYGVRLREKMAQKAAEPASHDEGIMARHDALFDYTLLPEHSLCYLQLNQCADARTQRDASLPRFDVLLEEMFGAIDSLGIATLVVDAQYNNGGNSGLCTELLLHLCRAEQLRDFTTYLRFSRLMEMYNPGVATVRQQWEAEGHADEMYCRPTPPMPPIEGQKIYGGRVVFVMSERTYSSAGMLMTLARDNHIGTIVGTTSSFPPSHYGEVLPYVLPNTGVFGTVCCKYFARPDVTHLEDEALEPDVRLDLTDKAAAWQYILTHYGK